eukprot:517757-Amphidinium_carterae.1
MEGHWADLHLSPQKSCKSPQCYRASLVFHCVWSADGGFPRIGFPRAQTHDFCPSDWSWGFAGGSRSRLDE